MSKTLFEWLGQQEMSTYAFAAKIGMSQASVWRIACGLQLPRREKRLRILNETRGEVDVYDEITIRRARAAFDARSDVAAA